MKIRKRNVFAGMIAALLVCFLAAAVYCFMRKSTFKYSNLADNESKTKVQTMLEANGIPRENISALFDLCEEFYRVPYNNIVKSGWKDALIQFFSYNENDAVDHLEKQPDNSLTCRMAAFIVLKDNISWSETDIVPAVMKDPQSRQKLTDDEDLTHYDLLFSNIENFAVTSSQDLVNTVTAYWKDAGIVFENENVRLITAYGSSGGDAAVQNIHTAISIYDAGSVWLLEKYDPIFPFQLSCFNSEDQLIDYMKKRVSSEKNYAIFSNDHCIYQNQTFLLF